MEERKNDLNRREVIMGEKEEDRLKKRGKKRKTERDQEKKIEIKKEKTYMNDNVNTYANVNIRSSLDSTELSRREESGCNGFKASSIKN